MTYNVAGVPRGEPKMRATLLAILTAALLALPAVAFAETPTDDLYKHADSREQISTTTTTAEPKSSGLAFTGLDVGLVVLAGAAILGTGLALRRASRPDTE
jgi:hypothetical protein